MRLRMKIRGSQRDMGHNAPYLCIAERVAVNLRTVTISLNDSYNICTDASEYPYRRTKATTSMISSPWGTIR